jgi:hypothetical protein
MKPAEVVLSRGRGGEKMMLGGEPNQNILQTDMEMS